MQRIVFMGTPDFAVPILHALLDTQQVVGVVTQPDRPAGRGKRVQPPPVKQAALAAGVPVAQPVSLRKRESADFLLTWQPDLIVVAAFGQILRPWLLALPPLGCLNVHASLLPRWRGAAPIQHAVLAGDGRSGVCLMQMDAGIDTGAVYRCASCDLAPDETAATLHDKLAALGADLLRRDLPAILTGALTATPQDDRQATFAPQLQKEDGRLDWRESADALDRRVRAMTPWPGAWSVWNGEPLRIHAARPLPLPLAEDENRPAPGTVLPGGLVATGAGALALLTVQLPGKRPTPIAEFLRGRPAFVGSQLE
jgi:methionyl-tRNA formyltransferase